MSQRVKRPNRFEDGTVPAKRRKRPTAQEEEDASTLGWRPINDQKIYNRATTEAPAELFRKDLISAMKLPDSEPLACNEYWVIVDQWKQEWERGVQVPVNPDSLPAPSVTVSHCETANKVRTNAPEFKPPKTRYIRITKDERFKAEEHFLSATPSHADAACAYDLDECDAAWLKLVNNERLAMGAPPISEDQLERVIERYEVRCWERIRAILRNEEGVGIEYDENVICDVCRSPDSEEGNEMVFCDSCNICVHQACYGITRIPAGQWLCCTCTIQQRPDCVLCPNKGGAMKSTRSGQKWAHVSCALWIPEVSIGCVERMEPITKISSIPASRWALICVLCRERVGACIQCSVKTCKTAYHVTCAFKHGLEMRAIIEDENADDGVKLRSYCEKHSKSSKKAAATCSGSSDDDCKRKKRKDMTSEEKNQARAARQQEIEAEFFKHVSVKDISMHVDIDGDALHCIYNYWKLKRRAGHCKPLLAAQSDDVDLLTPKQEQADVEKMKMFVQLRQDLERVRNLCYMVSRREKLSRTYFKLRESTFQKQVAVLRCPTTLTPKCAGAVIAANRVSSIYDRFYSNPAADETINNLDSLVARITGCKSPPHVDEKKPTMNGLFKDVKNNPYQKVYFNGSSKRRSGSLYGSSLSTSESSDEKQAKPKYNKENRLHSAEEDKVKKNSRRKRFSITQNHLDSSSEEDVKQMRRDPFANSGLKQIEKAFGYSATDSDDLMPIRKASQSSPLRSSPFKKHASPIYSDTETESDSSTKNTSDTQSQSRLRTKAAVKEFSHKPNKSSPENNNKKKMTKDAPTTTKKKKKDYVPSDLIVPQRQAAKKATENLKSTTRTKELSNDGDGKLEEKEKVATAVVAVVSKPKKVGRPPKEQKKEATKEDNNVLDVDMEKETTTTTTTDKTEQDILAYVPQRQAAKKAAEHIKGLGYKPGAVQMDVEERREEKDGKKERKEQRKSSSNSSTSSSTSSSSDTSSSSSTESEDERSSPKKKKQSQSECLPTDGKEHTRRTGVKDWPFLDKAAKPAASSSDSSDSSDSSERLPPPRGSRPSSHQSGRQGVGDAKQSTASSEREESAARGKGRPAARRRARTTHASHRIGDAHVRHGNLAERCNAEREQQRPAKGGGQRESVELDGRGKSSEKDEARVEETTPDSPAKLLSPLRETEKTCKVNETSPKVTNSEIGDLEKEILERKAASNNKSSKSKFERLFGALEGKANKSPVKENKEPPTAVKLSPIKKSLDDIIANKLSNALNAKSPDPLPLKAQTPPPPPKIEDEKTNNGPLHNTHSNDDLLLDDIDHILEGGFGISKEEEMIKLPAALSFNIASTMVFKEDTKEDSARETLNLVEKLRGNMGLNKNKTTNYDIDDAISIASSKTEDRMELEQSVPTTIVETLQPVQPEISIEMHVSVAAKYDNDANGFNDDAQMVDKSVPDVEHQHTNATAPADERWIPPSSSDSYPNLQAVVETRPKNHQSPPVTRTPFLDAASSMDCSMPSPVPSFNDVHPQVKWAESNLIPNRRSSSSSIASSSASNISRRNVDEEEMMMMKRHEMPVFNHPASMQFPPTAMDMFPPFAAEAIHHHHHHQFVGNPVSLFPPANASTAQLPFPSPGAAALFPPPFGGAAFPTPLSVIPPMSKPNDEIMHIPPQTAAFTSSQHNMALTAAMVNMPSMLFSSTKPSSNEDENATKVHQEVSLSNNCTPNHVQPSPNPSVKSNNSSSGKKSPSKPTRTSARFVSQQTKSPSKSPAKSPRQELAKALSGRKDKKAGKGSSGRGTQSQSRGRGRGRGRGRPVIAATSSHDFDCNHPNTMHNKLVGTVYDLDFDDDMSNECEDLRAMRERRKSADVHERRAESPKFTSPSNKNRYHLSELRPPTPIHTAHSKPASPEVVAQVENAFPIVVPPVLPGPVDMRTYNSNAEPPQYNDAHLVSQQTHVEELDDYFEKEMLSAQPDKAEEPHVPEHNTIKVSLSDARNQLKVKIKGPIANYTSSYSSTVAPLPTVGETTATNALQTTHAIINNAINNTPVTNLHRMRKKELLRQYCSQGMNTTNDPTSASSGIPTTTISTPLPPSLNRTIITIPKAVASMTSIPTKDDYRDYRTGADELYEPKMRSKEKPKSGLARELRHLDIPIGGEENNTLERRRSSIGNNGTVVVAEHKRRGRPPRNQLQQQQTTPKLKIKIGGANVVSEAVSPPVEAISVNKIDDKRDRIRPPKKRLSASVAKPSVEDYKRESMKFRKQVMADFSEKKEKKKKDKSNRKSKKKKKQDVQIVPNETNATTTKLIIRFKKNEKTVEDPAPNAKPVENKDEHQEPIAAAAAGGAPDPTLTITTPLAIITSPDATPNEAKSNDISCSSSSQIVSPIKLKLARCQKGYVMKTHQADAACRGSNVDHHLDACKTLDRSPLLQPPASATLNLHEPPPPPPVHTATPLPLNKDCEVR